MSTLYGAELGTNTQVPTRASPDWRRSLRAKIAWLLLAKLIGLILLWALFFSPEHRTAVTAERAARAFAVEGSKP